MSQRVLAINPGSTSTKMAVFSREKKEFELKANLDEHSVSKGNVYEEFSFRKMQIEKALGEHKIGDIDIVVGRGGILKPLQSGAYKICDSMLNDLESARYGNHASNLGAALARYFAEKFAVKGYIIDSVVTDELCELARISGTPEIRRKSLSHALNIKATARQVCEEMNWDMEAENLLVAHLGGGISICAMEKGRSVDVNDALLGLGPFSPERAGALPLGAMLELCYRTGRDEKAMRKLLTRESGLKGYLGTNDVREVEGRINDGDKEARLIMDAMIYQIRKEIGAMSAVVDFNVKALIVTGGVAHSAYLQKELKQHLGGKFKIIFRPGENELEAMGDGGFRILDGKMIIHDYDNE